MLKNLIFSVFFTLVSSSALAIAPSATAPDMELFISGSSYIDTALNALVPSLCVSGTLDTYKSGSDYSAYYCSFDTSKVTGGLPAWSTVHPGNKPKILIHKRSLGGSIYGVNPLIEITPVTQMNIWNTLTNTSNCTQTVPGSQDWNCTVTNPGDTSEMYSDVGVSDVNPQLFVGANTAYGFNPVNANTAGAALNISGAEVIVFGVSVSLNLRNALQQAQGLVVGDETQANMPTLNKAQIGSLTISTIRKWTQLMVNGVPLTSAAGVAAPTNNKVTICRYSKGSGLQAQFMAHFLNYPCLPTAASASSISSPLIGPIIIDSFDEDGVGSCLDAANTANNWAIGSLSTSMNSNNAAGYRFIKINNVAPTLTNAANGSYQDWSEPTIQWRTEMPGALIGDKLNLVQTIATKVASPDIIRSLNTGSMYTWGQGGKLSLQSNGYSASFPFDGNNPVMPYNYDFTGPVDNCRIPVASSISMDNLSPPQVLSYSSNPAIYQVNIAISPNTPSYLGGQVTSFTVSPALPAGLNFNTNTGSISGTPTSISNTAMYTVTATNSTGSASALLSITVNDQAPVALTYGFNPAVYFVGNVIAQNVPSNQGGRVSSYSVSPALPAGLSLNPATGIISGTPTVAAAATNYTVTASNISGSSTVNLSIAVNDVGVPIALTYSDNPAFYILGAPVTPNTPSNLGKTTSYAASYTVFPVLPAGLNLNNTTGVISGTPAVLTGYTRYTVVAKSSGGLVASTPVWITVVAAGSVNTLAVKSCLTGNGCLKSAVDMGAKYFQQTVDTNGKVLSVVYFDASMAKMSIQYDNNGIVIASNVVPVYQAPSDPVGPKPGFNSNNISDGTTMEDGSSQTVTANDYVGNTLVETAVEQDGSAQFTIPLILPPGANGQAPKLDIIYNSRKLDGLLGQGAGIDGLSVITRCPAKVIVDSYSGSVNFDVNDRYCLDGQRLIAINNGIDGVSGTEYRTEIDSNTKVVSYGSTGSSTGNFGPTYFVVNTKSGDTLYYGTDNNGNKESAIKVPTGAIKRWAIGKKVDKSNNYVVYHYAQAGVANNLCSVNGSLIPDLPNGSGEYLPCRIEYTGNTGAGQLPFASIVFTYIQRQDVLTGYVGNTLETHSQLVHNISTYLGTTLVKEYKLEYVNFTGLMAGANYSSKLTNVQECNNVSQCKHPVHINWTNYSTSPIEKNHIKLVDGFEAYTSGYQAITGDFNGDAATDLVLINNTTNKFCPGPGITASANCVPLSGLPLTMNTYVQQGDYNGDGIVDVYVVGTTAGSSSFCPGPIISNENSAYINCTKSESSSIFNSSGGSVQTADFNGDSHADLFVINPAAQHSVLCLDASFGGQSFYKSGSYLDLPVATGGGCKSLPTNFSQGGKILIGDFNGDGYKDIMTILAVTIYPGVTNISFCQGSISGIIGCQLLPPKSGSANWSGSLYFYKDGNANNVTSGTVASGDYNGDGYDDLFVLGSNGTSVFCPGPGISIGDSCMSIAISAPGGWYARIIQSLTNSGANISVEEFGLDSGWGQPDNYQGLAIADDFNGDGRADILIKNHTNHYFCDSLALITPNLASHACIDVTPPQLKRTDFTKAPYILRTWGVSYQIILNDYNILPGDYNGDSSADLLLIGADGLYYSEGIDSGRSVSKVTDSKGKITEFEYTTLANPDVYEAYVGSTSAGALLHIPMQVVSNYKVSNSADGLNEYDFTYSGAMYDADRGYLGFANRTITDVAKNLITTETYNQNYPFIGKLASRSVSERYGNLLSSTDYTYQTTPITYTNVRLPYLYNKATTLYNFETGYPYETQSLLNNAVDILGDVTQQINTVTDLINSETFITTANNTYPYTNSSNWAIRGLLTETDVTQSGSQGISATLNRKFEYDNGTPSQGFLTKDTIAPDTTNMAPGSRYELNTAYEYDQFGNVHIKTMSPSASLLSTDPAFFVPRVTTINYESLGRFPLSMNNGQNVQNEIYSYDARFGIRTDLTAIDGAHTHWDDDPFGQLTDIIRPDGTKQTYEAAWGDGTTKVANMLPGAGGSGNQVRYQLTTQDYDNAGAIVSAPTIQSFNVTGDLIRVNKKGFDGSDIYTDINYDKLGRKYAISRPYYASDVTGKYPTETVYDALNRIVQVNDPAGVATTNNYNGLVITTTKVFNSQSQSQSTVTTLNALGQVKTVTDANLKTLTHDYINTLSGHTETITDSANNVTQMDFDILGNKIAMHDPDMGVWDYGYNALGEQIWIRSPNNASAGSTYTSLFARDALGRVINRYDYKPNIFDPNSIENTITWTYDNLVPGKLSSVTSSPTDAFSRSYTYDSDKRISSITSTINSNSYTVGYGYDNDGRVQTLTYPSGFAVQNNYNAQGYLSQVVNGLDPSLVYWEGVETTADGQFSNVNYGNGVNIIRGYDPASGRVKLAEAENSSTVLQYDNYTYDGIGNLLTRDDTLSGNNDVFSYDVLNRLSADTLNSANTTTMGYDDLGNVITMPGVGTYTYKSTTTRPHAVESIAGTHASTFTYDADGNMLTGNNRTIGWTSFDKPRKITQSNNLSVYATFRYDPDSNRISQTADTGTTVYLNPESSAGAHFEAYFAPGSTVPENRHYIYAGDNLVALYTTKTGSASTTEYFLKDHLGSTEVVTDSNGAVLERLSYGPYGNSRLVSNWLNSPLPVTATSTTRGFTGQEQLNELGLINLNGRFYDPLIGRFLSADPYIQDSHNLQSYNRYSYVMNNPLSYTDPTGYSSVSANDPAYNPATGDIYYPNTNSWLNFDPQTFGSKNGNSGFFSLNLPKLDLGSDYLQNTQLGEAGSWGFGNTADGQSNYSGAGFYSSIGPTPYNFYTDNIIGRILSDFVSPLELFTDNHLNPLSHMDNNVSRVDAAMAIIALGIGTEEKGVAIGLKGFTSGQLGRAGEELASQITGVGKNFRSWFVNGRARIPDQVLAQDIATRNPLIVVEVKNVRYQSLTRQLRDYTDLVGPGGRVDVMLPPGARVSGPLQRAFDNPVSPLSRVDLLAP